MRQIEEGGDRPIRRAQQVMKQYIPNKQPKIGMKSPERLNQKQLAGQIAQKEVNETMRPSSLS
jgi:hypothetical protein